MSCSRRVAGCAAGRPIRYLQVSTDEVYGSVEEGRSGEGDRLAPRSPYAAAKAAGELLVRSYVVTHGLDAVVTRGSNTYGPYHHPEKLIPLFVTNALDDLPLPLYGDGLQIRDWLYVDRSRGGDRARPPSRPGRRDLQPGRRHRAAEPRGRPADPRAAGQAVVARPLGARPAGPRPALRHGRIEGGRARLAADGRLRRRARRRRSTGTSRTRPGGGPSSRATGTPTTSASTATGWPAWPPPRSETAGGAG